MSEIEAFWEARADRFAPEGEGLRAVCSYAMPAFYNRAIDLTQRVALDAVIRSIGSADSVLEYGCGIGRWTRQIARYSRDVVGVDFSTSMLREAERRTAAAGLKSRCRFMQCDVSALDLRRQFDLVIGVTVLQHIVEETRFRSAVEQLAHHVKPGGRLVIFEAAPSTVDHRADTGTFHARPLADYLDRIALAGLTVEQMRGVDPAPFKLWVIPRYAQWPGPVRAAALGLTVLSSLPVDLVFGARFVRSSWHKIIVARASGCPQ
jgi:ubiquinone/menaquinone biosynthesis C-methylase UbiE